MAMDAKAVDAKRVDLEKALRDGAPASSVLKILGDLKTGVVPSEKLLRETKIGVQVNRLKTHADPNVKKMASEMVTQWRTAMTVLKAKGSGASTPKVAANGTASPAPAPASWSPAAADAGSVKKEKNIYNGDVAKRNAQVDKVDYGLTDNKARDECIKLMYNGLAHMSSELPDDVLEKAREVELAAYNKFQPETSEPYKSKMRSLYMNLKNKSAPHLRVRILNGQITPEKFVVMTHDEMKSSEKRAEEERLMKENMDKAMVPQEVKSISNALRCGKCGQKKVSYTQAQTRSADEPMTTFCTCTNCGNRWKFS